MTRVIDYQPDGKAKRLKVPCFCRVCRRHVMLKFLCLVLLSGLALVGTACSVKSPSQEMEGKIHSAEDLAVSVQQVRLRTRALVEPYCSIIVESADRIGAGTTDRGIRREALLWKMHAVPALRQALFLPNPFAAILDTWVLTLQMTDYFEQGPGKAALGVASPSAAATSRYLESELAEVAASLTQSGNLDDVQKFAAQWASDHPIRHSIAGRESILSTVTEREIQDTFSMPEVAVALVVTLDDLSRRIEIYSAQLLDQSRWQAELFTMDLVDDYQVEQAIPLAASAVQAAAQSIEAVNRITPTLEAALKAVESSPELLAKERSAAIAAMQVELSRTLRFIQEERIAALRHLTDERKAALLELNRILVEEHKALINDMEQIGLRLLDHTFMRLAQLAAAVLLVLILAFVPAMVIRKRSSRRLKPPASPGAVPGKPAS